MNQLSNRAFRTNNPNSLSYNHTQHSTKGAFLLFGLCTVNHTDNASQSLLHLNSSKPGLYMALTFRQVMDAFNDIGWLFCRGISSKYVAQDRNDSENMCKFDSLEDAWDWFIHTKQSEILSEDISVSRMQPTEDIILELLTHAQRQAEMHSVTAHNDDDVDATRAHTVLAIIELALKIHTQP